MIWCYADYLPDLWGLPPCDEAKPIPGYAMVTVNKDEYYTNPASHIVSLYGQYLNGVQGI
jgi:hypothetical protein